MAWKSVLRWWSMPVLAGVVLLNVFCSGEAASTSGPKSAARVVKTLPVEQAPETRDLRFSGVTRAVRRAQLSFTIPGRLTARPAQIGMVVRKGEVLARLDSREIVNAAGAARAEKARIESQLEQANRDRDRVASLWESDYAATQMLEQSRTGVAALSAARDAAAAQLAETERLLSETAIRASFDGIVTEVLAEPGEYVGPGQPVVIVSGADVEVEIELPESLSAQIDPDSAVTADLPLVGVVGVPARISSLGVTASGPGRLFPAVIALEPREGVRPGMTASVTIGVRSHADLSVPVPAIVNPARTMPSVYRVRDGVARRVPVSIGEFLGESVTVSGDLAVGDEVVVVGQIGLLDGEVVEVAP